MAVLPRNSDRPEYSLPGVPTWMVPDHKNVGFMAVREILPGALLLSERRLPVFLSKTSDPLRDFLSR